MSNGRQVNSRSSFWFKSVGMLFLFVAPLGCGPLDEAEQSDVSRATEDLVVNIRIAGHVGAGRVGISAVSVTLGGAQQATAMTDSNGNFKFDVPPGGAYTLAFSKPGATLAPPSINLGQQAVSSFRNVTCTAGCTFPAAIVPARELVITDPAVMNDPRTSSAAAGPWSFRALMRDMAPAGQNENVFTSAWLSQIATGGSINGFPIDPRNVAALGFVKAGPAGVLNWGNQLRLVAIVNRTDLHSTGAGELRFVYAAGNSMTVIFEYGLPGTRDRRGWATQFHALAALDPTTPAYRTALQAITDQVVRRNMSPTKINGSAINQVRVNELLLQTAASPNWQMREFHLDINGALTFFLTAGTPTDLANVAGSPLNNQLATFINNAENTVSLQGGYISVPATSLVGGQSTEPFGAQNTFWSNFGIAVNPVSRHAFAGATCNGCHFSEVNRNLPVGVANPQNIAGFYHIAPTGALSPLMNTVEIPRRAIFAQHILGCAANCATGAEPMLP